MKYPIKLTEVFITGPVWNRVHQESSLLIDANLIQSVENTGNRDGTNYVNLGNLAYMVGDSVPEINAKIEAAKIAIQNY